MDITRTAMQQAPQIYPAFNAMQDTNQSAQRTELEASGKWSPPTTPYTCPIPKGKGPGLDEEMHE